MRLLILIHSLSCGGAERVTANLVTYWVEQGWDVTVATLAPRSYDFYPLPSGVRRVALGLAGESRSVLAALRHNIARVRAVRRLLDETNADVALGMMTGANVLLALATGRRRRCAVFGSEHVHPPQVRLGAIWEWLRVHSYARLDVVTALTDESRLWLERCTRARRVIVIPNAVPWPLPCHAPQVAPPADRNRRGVVAVGRMVEQKSLDRLVAAFARLAPEFPTWDLWLVGDGPLRSALVKQIEDLGLSGRVLLPGRIGNVADWYGAADLYVMSSRFEGFGNTLAEAMACGLPSVSFDCDTGPRDIIRHGVDGLLVPPEDMAALAAAMRGLMADEAMRRRMAARAIEARERFSIRRIASMWEALFDEEKNRRR